MKCADDDENNGDTNNHEMSVVVLDKDEEDLPVASGETFLSLNKALTFKRERCV
jgi:hypothetical protein